MYFFHKAHWSIPLRPVSVSINLYQYHSTSINRQYKPFGIHHDMYETPNDWLHPSQGSVASNRSAISMSSRAMRRKDSAAVAPEAWSSSTMPWNKKGISSDNPGGYNGEYCAQTISNYSKTWPYIVKPFKPYKFWKAEICFHAFSIVSFCVDPNMPNAK